MIDCGAPFTVAGLQTMQEMHGITQDDLNKAEIRRLKFGNYDLSEQRTLGYVEIPFVGSWLRVHVIEGDLQILVSLNTLY